MSDTRNLWHLQCAGKMARASTDLQLAYAGGALDSGRCTDSELLNELEREFFLSRKASTAILTQAKEARNA
jgi:hypothetical protein